MVKPKRSHPAKIEILEKLNGNFFTVTYYLFISNVTFQFGTFNL